ncbi:MAG: hypothetical protein HRT64_05845 [Erythrobacter sp.]|nr:hypothetical protein [Erythrobacter sp.]
MFARSFMRPHLGLPSDARKLSECDFGGPKTPEAFREACTRFIDVNKLLKSEKAEKESGKPEATSSEDTETAFQFDAELLNLLVDAYNASKRDERGFAKLSEVGQRAGNRSSFDTRNYGFTRLFDLVDAIPNFRIERRDNGEVWIRRVR